MPFEGPPGQPPPSGEGGTLEVPPEEIARASGASLELQRRPNLELQRSPKLELSRLELKPEFRPGMVAPSADREVMTRSPFKSGEGLPPAPPRRPAASRSEQASAERAPGEEALEMSGWGEQAVAPSAQPPVVVTPKRAARLEQETIPVDITFTPRPTRRRVSSISPAQKAVLGGFLLIVIAVLLWPRSTAQPARAERPTTPVAVETTPEAAPESPGVLPLTALTNPEFVGPHQPAAGQASTPAPAVEETPTPAAPEPVAAVPAPVAPPPAPVETTTPEAAAETPAPAPAEPLAVTVMTTPKDVQATVILAKDDLRYEESGSGSIKLAPDKAGSYKLKVSAPGYKTYQGTLKVARSHRLAVALEALPPPPPAAPAYEPPPPSYYEPPVYSGGGGGGRSGGGGGGRYELPAPGL